MKLFHVLFLFCLTTFSGFSQNQPVPAYLTTQDFPDSVRMVSAESLSGEALTLNDILAKHKGKTIVMDIWASWCRDCIVGVPKMNDIMKDYADENAVFVFLSVDTDATKWRSAIKRFNIPGEHFRLKAGWKNAFSNYIVLDWVPRYMVFNESGRIVKPKAITADALEVLLLELAKK